MKFNHDSNPSDSTQKSSTLGLTLDIKNLSQKTEKSLLQEVVAPQKTKKVTVNEGSGSDGAKTGSALAGVLL